MIDHAGSPAGCSMSLKLARPSTNPHSRKGREVVKLIIGGFLVISLGIIGFLIYDAIAGAGGLTSWILAVCWSVATVLIIGAIFRGLIRQQAG